MVGTLVKCQDVHAASCWPELEELSGQFLYLTFDKRNVDAAEYEFARSQLARTLRNCPADEEFSMDLSRGTEPSPAYVLLLDLTILADDVEMTSVFFERLSSDPSLDIPDEQLRYGDKYLQMAVGVESDNVVGWLLDHGFDPNEVDERGATALHYSRARTDKGLRAIRSLVMHGANIEMLAEFNFTPMIGARQKGDLRKAQCLYSLGAQIPSEDEYPDGISYFTNPEDVQVVDDFLNSEQKNIPERIQTICSRSKP